MFTGEGIFFLGKCMMFNRNSTYQNDILFLPLKKSAQLAENAQIPNFGSNSTNRKYFFCKKNSISFYTSKTIGKTKGTKISSNFAFFQPYLRINTLECDGDARDANDESDCGYSTWNYDESNCVEQGKWWQSRWPWWQYWRQRGEIALKRYWKPEYFLSINCMFCNT